MIGYLVLLQVFFSVFAADDGAIVTTSNGLIQGRIRRSLNEQKYYAFEGIPYAAPPVGNKRFKAPQEPEYWDDILETKRNDKMCLQIIAVIPQGSEDCLYLNVYTPMDLKEKNSTNTSLPVIVWIHGGGFQIGSTTSIKPNYFMDYDVVVVTVNYRLGVFGFLSTGDDVISGNFGLKDQRFALQWVKKNIAQFGGDPNKVTLAGQSAGAVSISYQLLATKNKGLFKGAIMESGSSLCAHDFESDPKQYAFKLAKLIDSSFSGNSEDLLKLLRKQPADKLARTANALKLRYLPINDLKNSVFLFNIWLPVIEDTNTDDVLITAPMHQSFMDGKFLKVPILTGFNSEEAVFFPDLVAALTVSFRADDHPNILIDDHLNIEDKLEAGKKLKAGYTTSFKDNPGLFLEFLSDNLYTTPVIRQAELVSKESPVYLYEFGYRSTRSKPPIPGADDVGHTYELKYLWGDKTFKNRNDKLTHERMMKMWTNFIKYQNPTPGEDEILTKWPKIKSTDIEYLIINSTLDVAKQPKRYKQWRSVLSDYTSKPYWVY